MRIGLIRIVLIPILLCSCSTTTVEKIALERRNLSDQIPAKCSQTRLLAEKAFRKKWVAYLIEPAETELFSSTTPVTEKTETYLAPVQSYRIAHDEWTLTNRLVSAFINCEKSEGYVHARGGVLDRDEWYGPFAL